jgi:hypothetical protein
MACERYRDTLSDVAAGASTSAEIEAHLASCDACRLELGALRQALAVADDDLARLLQVEPSPDLTARIRRTAAESAEAEPGWHLGWRFMLTAAAAALFVATVYVASRGPQPRPAMLAAGVRPGMPPETPAAATASEVVPPVAEAAPMTRRLRITIAPPVREPQVLVPAGEAEALLRFAADLRGRSVAQDSLLVVDLSAPLAEPQVGEIRSLDIVPLDPAESAGAE